MTVRELVQLLMLADPDAVVLGEYDGGYGEIEPDDVRVGNVTRVELFPVGPHRAEPYIHWSPGLHRDDDHPHTFHKCVLLDGDSSRYPQRLDGKPTE